MSGYPLSNVSVGLGSMLPACKEMRVNPVPSNLVYLNANANNNNQVDHGGGDAQKKDRGSSPPRSASRSSANQSNSKNDAKDEKQALECTSYKIGKGKKKNNLDSMEELLFKLTNGNFKAEKHHVYTADGYRLNLYRIVSTNKKDNLQKKKEVFCLNHGLFESSISYTCKGYESLAFQIFANDYDVWISNNRGNAFTKYVGKDYALKKLKERYSLQDLKDIGVEVTEEMAAQGSSSASGDDEKKSTESASSSDEEGCREKGKNNNLRKAGKADDNAANNSSGKKNSEGTKSSVEESKSVPPCCGTPGAKPSIGDASPAEGGSKVGSNKAEKSSPCTSSSSDSEGPEDAPANIDSRALSDIFKRAKGSKGADKNESIKKVYCGIGIPDEVDPSLSADDESTVNSEGEKQEEDELDEGDYNLGYEIDGSPDPPGPFGDSSSCDSNMVCSFPYVPKDPENGEAAGEAAECAEGVEDGEEVEELVNLNKHSEEDDVVELNVPEMDNWTFEDMGTKDLPAVIKYIKNKTQREQIVYVGFSQGSVQLLIGCCLNDYLNNSIKRTYLLSLPIILKNKDELLKSVKMLLIASRWYKAIIGSKEFIQKVFPEKMSTSMISSSADLFTRNFFKLYTENVDENYKKIYFRHTPSGTTSKANLKKWCSSLHDGPVSEAIDKYAHKCSFPITLVYGIKDCLVDAERSIEYMKKKFTKNDLKIISEPEWSHIDPVLADNRNVVLSCILEDLKGEEKQEEGEEKETKQEEKETKQEEEKETKQEEEKETKQEEKKQTKQEEKKQTKQEEKKKQQEEKKKQQEEKKKQLKK
ncbi:hypothetical protein PVIIG_06033 [Plasmodium vivax India VII]|uniref:Partial AB-hydrolase lipase domain-containing protein n=1 Tax=Plasmodium vivax India VII TaxID=1077284 RepID=A0A0J9SBW9_PLAVI|nr:hypothetical protein PVIIG_06033 [Plasmodium vivax India VII]